MLRSRLVLGCLGVALAPLALGACGGTSSAPAAPSTPTAASAGSASASSPSSAPPGPGVVFCTQLRANGANGASFGPILLTDRKQRLLNDVQGKLDAMGDARPPSEITKQWSVQKTMLQRARSEGHKLREDESLGDASPPLDFSKFYGGEIAKAQDTLTDYWFAPCH